MVGARAVLGWRTDRSSGTSSTDELFWELGVSALGDVSSLNLGTGTVLLMLATIAESSFTKAQSELV